MQRRFALVLAIVVSLAFVIFVLSPNPEAQDDILGELNKLDERPIQNNSAIENTLEDEFELAYEETGVASASQPDNVAASPTSDSEYFSFAVESQFIAFVANVDTQKNPHLDFVLSAFDKNSSILATREVHFEGSYNGKYYTTPIDLPEGAVRVTVEGVGLSNLSLEQIDGRIIEPTTPGDSRTTSHTAPQYADDLMGNIGLTKPFVTRSQWGAPVASEWYPSHRNVYRIVVHHTAMSSSLDPYAAMASIYNYHAYSRGWGDIGYNYVIAPNGVIFEGREGSNGAVGAHAIPNSGTIGISLMGNFQSEQPTQAALNSLAELVARLAELNNLDVTYGSTLVYHNMHSQQNGQPGTSCAGTNLISRIPTIAAQAQAMVDSWTWGDTLHDAYSEKFLARDPEFDPKEYRIRMQSSNESLSYEMGSSLYYSDYYNISPVLGPHAIDYFKVKFLSNGGYFKKQMMIEFLLNNPSVELDRINTYDSFVTD